MKKLKIIRSLNYNMEETTQDKITSLFNNFKNFMLEKEDLTYAKKRQLEVLFDNFKEFLIEKNKRYGDSALTPQNIYSKADSSSQICNRLDDKLSRIKTSTKLKKNDVCDNFGYLALLMIEEGWLTFGDLLD
jgi:hypothetical protein